MVKADSDDDEEEEEEEQDDIKIDDDEEDDKSEEEELYGWQLNNEDDLAQKRSKEVALDMQYEKYLEYNKRVQEQHKEVVKERQDKKKSKTCTSSL
eukprot:UN03173